MTIIYPSNRLKCRVKVATKDFNSKKITNFAA